MQNTEEVISKGIGIPWIPQPHHYDNKKYIINYLFQQLTCLPSF